MAGSLGDIGLDATQPCVWGSGPGGGYAV